MFVKREKSEIFSTSFTSTSSLSFASPFVSLGAGAVVVVDVSSDFLSSSLGAGLARAELAGVPLCGVVQVKGVVASDSFLMKCKSHVNTFNLSVGFFTGLKHQATF